MNEDLISRKALKKQFGYTDEWYKSRTVTQIIDNAPTVEPYQGEECVNIKMSDEEIKQFKQMLQEHTPLYTDTFVEGASAERPQGEWKALNFHACYCTNCHFDFDIMKCNFMAKMNFCPNCGADMTGGRE